ncbi:methyltransferase domain-containing protein [Tenggerimyces flavus]|uniref:Methyltransferase domain-containing protein n=1 Tax=Tenggerimyces flavus TaxID=1708749 RepID=A0ABV7YMJ5_9ACTN|nr:methyltransferase domain-containing protein [Tenggerimyces flavus]MBM7784961.1 ubiquinone/menaquinone biosynthesis C-methylase UbiE [Tenggerimyces flavus]
MSEEFSQVSDQAAVFYEEFLLPALFAQWTSVMLDAANVGPADRVLDIACGTGVLARAATERVGKQGEVVGIDRNPGMLSVARTKAPEITWQEGLAEELPYQQEEFDAVVCQFGLMYFDDQRGALAEMWRVLRPGGSIAVAVWAGLDQVPAYQGFNAIVGRLFGAEAERAMNAPFSLGDPATLSSLATEAGIPDARVVTHRGTTRFPSMDWWVTADGKGWLLERYVDDAGLARLLERATDVLAEYVTADGRVEFAMPANLLSATRTS